MAHNIEKVRTMKITICGSIFFVKEMKGIQQELKKTKTTNLFKTAEKYGVVFRGFSGIHQEVQRLLGVGFN